MKNIIQSITGRRSVRTFTGQALSPENIRKIERFLEELPQLPIPVETNGDADNPQLRLLPGINAEGRIGTYGFIKDARDYVALACGPSTRQKMLAAYRTEQLVLWLCEHGLGSCWIGGTFHASQFAEAFGDCEAGKEIGIVLPVGSPRERLRMVERIMRKLDSADHRKPFSSLFTGADAPTPYLMQLACGPLPAELNLEQAISVALETVRLAPSSVNCQPWRATICRDKAEITATFTSAKTGKLIGYDMGIAMCHFCETLRFLGVEHYAEIHEPTKTDFVVKIPLRM